MKSITISLIIIFITSFLSNLSAQDGKPVAYWNFDAEFKNLVQDSNDNKRIDIYVGNTKSVKGISKSALNFDGYSTAVKRAPHNSPIIDGSFTIEAWIAIAAYPWNWAPIVAQENTESLNSNLDKYCWPDDIKQTSPKDGYYFGISPKGELGLMLGADYEFKLCKTSAKVPLYKWTFITAVYEKGTGIKLYIDGILSGELKITSDPRFANDEDLIIGMNREKREPAYPVRPFATLACWYSFDGLMDEINIYSNPISESTINNNMNSRGKISDPDLQKRELPSGPEGPSKFGASYHTLKYYDGWDDLWPVGPDADIVVRFDDSPIKVIFWRGTRYSPVWVMENKMMMADQSIENFDYVDGCYEHMLDPRCRFSHVRIIENTDARVVVHWRYCPTAASGNHSQVNEITGWEDWVDEYHTFFPDGTSVRKVVQYSNGISLWPEEVIALCHPGQSPEDVIELEAMTLVNHNGDNLTLSWSGETAQLNDERFLNTFGSEEKDKPVIMMSNLKSKNRPYKIYEEGSNVRIFAHEQRKDVSNFPWWNHWPVAMIPSDGRYCQAADRASHFSLAWGGVNPNKGDGDFYWWAIIYGATENPATELVPLERSWNNPPELILNNENYKYHGYDKSQRCYQLENLNKNKPEDLRFVLNASEASPVSNTSVEIINWGELKFNFFINDEEIKEGNDYRTGYINKTDTENLIIWLEKSSFSELTIKISPINKD